jgi:integrase
MKLTNRAVVSAVLPKGQTEKWYLDDEVKGLALRVYRTSSGIGRAFVFRYSYGGKQRKIPLGTAVPKEPGVETTPGTVTLEDARRRAVGYWSQLEDGQDPGTVRAERRIVEPTVAEISADFIANMSMVDEKTGRTKRKSVDRMRQALDKYILPVIGERRMNDLSQGDAHRLHMSITRAGKGTTANRVLALLSSVWGFYEKTRDKKPGESRRENPCRSVERNEETKRETFLSEKELERLGDALATAEEKLALGPSPRRSAILAVRLLVLTGARKSEILTLRREWVDFQRGVAFLPTSKTGAKILPLGEAALELIQQAPEKPGNPYVCPGEGTGPLIGLHKIWDEIRKEAKLSHVRIHDLRHTFASEGIGSGHSLPVIGKILGHTSWQTTERYAHLADSPVRAAVNSISGRIGSKLLAFRKTA